MMKLFQKAHMRKWGFVVSSLIVVSFMLWGGSASQLGGNSGITYAGKIFGRKIAFEEFEKSLRQVQIQARMQYGENFRKLQDALNLDGQAWDRLILLQEAKKRRIQVSDAEVMETIASGYGLRKKNGTVDPQAYEYTIRSNFGVPPRVFEEGLRDSLRIARVFQEETAQITISADEAQKAYTTRNQKIQVSYTIFPTEDLKSQIAFDETAAKEYFASHKDEFVMPPTVNVEFLQIAIAPTPTQEENKSADAATSNETPVTPTDLRDAAWEKALALYETITGGKNFAQVAKENDLAIGVSGLFPMEQPILKPGWTFPIIQKLFQADEGDVLEPIETPDGYQLLRIKEKKDAYIPEYEQAKEKVREHWIADQARKLSKEKSEQAYQSLVSEFTKFKNPDFVAITKSLGLNIQQTPAFGQGEYLPTLGIAKDFQETAFKLTEASRLSGPVDTTKGYCLLYLDKIIPADMKEFEKEKEKLQERLLIEKRTEEFNNFLTKLRIQANLEDNIAKLKAQQKRRAQY